MVKKAYEKKYEGLVINGIKVLGFSHKDKHNNEYVVAECPICSEEWTVQLNNIKSGHSKSCGCLRRKRARELGLSNKKNNPIYYPRGYNYALLFLRNVDRYIIVDIDAIPKIKKHTWYGRVRDAKNNKIDAYTKINNKTVYLTNYLLETDTEAGFQVDHVSGETRDNRRCNTRNATREQNSLNKESAKDVELCINEDNGKYIVHFTGYVKDKVYDSLEDAQASLQEYKKYTYSYSQELARENESNQFAIEDALIVGGVFEKIVNSKGFNIGKVLMAEAFKNKRNHILSEDEFWDELIRIETFYKKNFLEDNMDDISA